MSQFDDVSNIANPTFDAELAMSMTVNAKLPKTPQRQSWPAGASDLTLDSLDNKDPIGRVRNEGQYPPKPLVKWRTTVEVSRRPNSPEEARRCLKSNLRNKST